MPVITLTSDWNQKDYYLSAVKGQILKKDNTIRIVDINHNILTFNAVQAAFIIRNSFHHFPERSVHINFVNTERSDNQYFIAAEAHGHFFIGNDNGAFSLMYNDTAKRIVKLESLETETYESFPGLFTFTNAACDILKKGDLSQSGKEFSNLQQTIPLRATIEKNSITGTVIYTDSYGNVITNIKKELFERVGKQQSFEIYVQSKHYMINKINKAYSSVISGELVAVFNSAGLLEIAINNGNAKKLLNLGLNSNIRIEFVGNGER